MIFSFIFCIMQYAKGTNKYNSLLFNLMYPLSALPSVPPQAPTDLSADSVTECSATLTWKAPCSNDDSNTSDVDEYIVEIRRRKTDKDYREVCRLPGSKLSTIIEELEEDEEYDVIVKAVNKAGESEDVAELDGGIKTKKKQGMSSLYGVKQIWNQII